MGLLEEYKKWLSRKWLYEFCFIFPQPEDLEPWQFEYPKEELPAHIKKEDCFRIEYEDKEWAEFFAKIPVKYGTVPDRRRERTLEQRLYNNLIGLLGEKYVHDKLKEWKIIHYWNERDPKYYEKHEMGEMYYAPFDFAIPTRNGSYISLEIKTVQPYAKAKHLIDYKPKNGKWRFRDYYIGIKILKLESKPDSEGEHFKVIGYGCICGYLTKEEMEALKTRDHEYPCYDICKAKPLKELKPISELWEIIKSKAITWKE